MAGDKLKELLKRHGEFAKIEVSIKKWVEKKARFDKKGGWYTKVWLQNERHWTKNLSSNILHCLMHYRFWSTPTDPRKMLDAAWDWAERHHKKRKNPVHGEEEIGIVLDDEFLFRTEKGEGMSQQGDFDLEDPTDYTACSPYRLYSRTYFLKNTRRTQMVHCSMPTGSLTQQPAMKP